MALILGIETSCDETGVALYDTDNGLIANELYSQIELHQAYGGVVPELASRDHLRKIISLIDNCLNKASCKLSDLAAIAYTAGPGLNGALLVGASVANSIAWANNLAVIPIHHLEGHLLSPFLGNKQLAAPFIALLVSGGHSQLIAVNKIGNYQLLGDSVDDAAGEAFDKTAKMLGLAYPGGKHIAALATQGSDIYKLPRPMINSGDLSMSFSGLKTAVLTLLNKLKSQNIAIEGQVLADMAASIEHAITDVLIKKSLLAIKMTGIRQLIVCGGVSANLTLRAKLNKLAVSNNFSVHYPPLELCTDNGAMIAIAGAYRLTQKQFNYNFTVHPRWDLSTLNIGE